MGNGLDAELMLEKGFFPAINKTNAHLCHYLRKSPECQ